MSLQARRDRHILQVWDGSRLVYEMTDLQYAAHTPPPPPSREVGEAVRRFLSQERAAQEAREPVGRIARALQISRADALKLVDEIPASGREQMAQELEEIP